MDRIGSYLDEDEVDAPIAISKTCPVLSPSSDEGASLAIINGSFQWNTATIRADNARQSSAASSVDTFSSTPTFASPTRQHFELRDIHVAFPEGKLSLVTGPTASGKTALLMALLGELTTLHGRVITPKNSSKIDDSGLLRTISYAAQTPWLRHQSIKDNILFGFPYNEGRYRAILDCCALIPDLEMLEDGDATEIGVR